MQFNWDEDRRIDPDSLDAEAIRQPDLMWEYGRRQTEAKDALDRAEANLDFVAAQEGNRIRGELEKPTESALKAAVQATPRHVAAMKNYLDAKRENAMAVERVNALDGKKRMLELLAKLHGQQYFAGPTTPHDLGESLQRRTARAANATGMDARSATPRKLPREIPKSKK